MRLTEELARRALATEQGDRLVGRVLAGRTRASLNGVATLELLGQLFAEHAMEPAGVLGTDTQFFSYLTDTFQENADWDQWREPVTLPDQFDGTPREGVVQQLVDHATGVEFLEIQDWEGR